MRRTIVVLIVLVALAGALAASCSIFRGGPHSASPEPAPLVILRVANHNYLDVVIYVLHDGERTRVGTVTGSSSAVLYLPPHLLGAERVIQLLGDPIGSTDVASTEAISVQPGQSIEWTLETDLSRSSVAVY